VRYAARHGQQTTCRPVPGNSGPRASEGASHEPERFAGACQEFIAQFRVEPTTAQWAFWLRDQYGISTGASDPLSEAQLQPLLQVLQNRYAIPAVETTGVEGPQPTDQSWYDYFYSAWRSYEQERGAYLDAGALAAYVYERDGITGAGDRPISGEDLDGFVVSFRRREFDDAELRAEEAAADSGEQDRPSSSATATTICGWMTARRSTRRPVAGRGAVRAYGGAAGAVLGGGRTRDWGPSLGRPRVARMMFRARRREGPHSRCR
jgi:hypothetical protein